jgi:hypothetical protein
VRCPGCGVELNRKALKAGTCLQCNYALPIVGRARVQKVHNDTVRMPTPGGVSSFPPVPPPPPVPAAPGSGRKKPAIPPPSRKPLQLGNNAMDGMLEFSVGEVESSVHDDAPVPSVPSVSTADPDLSEIVARSRARSIQRSKDQMPPPPPPTYDGVPGMSGPRSLRRRETEQTLRMQAVDPLPPPVPRQSSFMVDLVLVLGIIAITLILTTVLIFALK